MELNDFLEMVILVIPAEDLGPDAQYNIYKDGDAYGASWPSEEMVLFQLNL